MEKLRFYHEWYPLEKGQFKILCMLADKGKFSGTLTDICRYFFVSPQTATRNRYKNSIEALSNGGYISIQQRGNIWSLEATPREKEKQTAIPRRDFETIRLRRPSKGKEAVAWEAVLKVYLWICDNNYDDIITNAEIKNDLNLSPGVICSAKNVLSKEFEAIARKLETEKVAEGEYRRKGQHLGVSSFWNYE